MKLSDESLAPAQDQHRHLAAFVRSAKRAASTLLRGGVGPHYRWLLLLPAFAVPDAPQPARPATHDLEQSARQWIGTWATAQQPFLPGSLENFRNQTLRLVVHTSTGGTKVRIRIANTYGDGPLLIGGAHIARRSVAANIDPSSDRTLTFGGRSTTTIPAESTVVSDPVELEVSPLSDLAISLFLPRATAATTSHALALQTSYVSSDTGNFAARTTFPAARTITSWPFLTGVDVDASSEGVAIVALGSSTTDGDGSTRDANQRWPDVLARRLQRAGVRKGEAGVLNQGIIGNRLLEDSPPETRDRFGAALGQSGLTRFDGDVLAQPGVRYVILCLGVNDISFPGVLTPATERVDAPDIISAYRQLIARAHARGVRVMGTTIPPFEGYRSHTPEKERTRQAVNAWIRGSGEFDALADFDAAVRDPSHPSRLLPAFDSGDHLHANDAGHAATANAIPLELFERH